MGATSKWSEREERDLGMFYFPLPSPPPRALFTSLRLAVAMSFHKGLSFRQLALSRAIDLTKFCMPNNYMPFIFQVKGEQQLSTIARSGLSHYPLMVFFNPKYIIIFGPSVNLFSTALWGMLLASWKTLDWSIHTSITERSNMIQGRVFWVFK